MTDSSAQQNYRFGRFELQPGERRLLVDGATVPLGPRAFDLLVALVERAGRLVSKEQLLELVWPRLVVEESNLQVQVSALRKVLGAETIATVPGHGYRFTPRLEQARATVDEPAQGLVTFLFTDIEGSTRLWEQDAERMRPALADHDRLARAAVEEHRGVVVKATGDGLHAAFDDALDALAAALQIQLALGDADEAGGIALRIRCGLHLGLDERRDNDFFGPAVNRAARIMGAAHGGQVLLSQAVAADLDGRLPADVSLRDLGSVRLRDLATPERIYQAVHPALRSDFPALRSLESTPNNLAQPLTSFIGREQTLVEVKALLGTTRLLTLLGVGGLGKTRLSQQLAFELMDDHPDGVWFVDLAPQTDERLVPQAVASALNVKEELDQPIAETLARHVKDRVLLLVLDNCEHLVGACAALARQLLESGPRTTIIATSREPLHVRGETTYHVPALSIPKPDERGADDALLRYEAVRLFIERARAVQPSFCITEHNAAAVVEICHRLDGIPLALELAAARVRTLSVENIALRLGDRFRLLKGSDQTALPRQQTLRALIDWSYDALSEPERLLLQRLSVFAGGWTLEAAETVGAGDAVDTTDVLDLLAHLVEKSLVVMEAGGGRYRLMDTVRHYAKERLEEGDESDAVRSRHLDFYLALAEEARPYLRGPAQGEWLAVLDRERENLLSGHAWCDRAPGGAECGLRLVSALRLYWRYRGPLGLGHRITLEALARAGATEHTHARCRALFDAGQLECVMGRYADGKAHLEESLAIARELGDKESTELVLQPLAMASLGQGNRVAAKMWLEQALDLANELGNKRERAAALNGLAQIHRMDGQLDQAEPLYYDVVALARELGDRDSVAIGLLNIAMVAIERGRLQRIDATLLEVLAISEEIESRQAGQSLLEVSAGLAAAREQWNIVARFYGAAEAQALETSLHRDPTDEAFLAPLIGRTKEALGALYAAAEDGGRALKYEEAMVEVRKWLTQQSQPTLAP